MVYLFLAEGFEEIEAITPLDILRRANIEIKTVGIGSNVIKGAHNIQIICDTVNKDLSFNNMEAIILPGGMPGAINLENDKTVQNAIDYCVQNNLLICAICAAPQILGHKGLLNGKKATCYPGFEDQLNKAVITNQKVIKDGNIITAWGPGAASEFGFEISKALKNNQTTETLKKSMMY